MATDTENSFPKANDYHVYGSEFTAAYFQHLMSDTLNYGNVSVTSSATQIKAANTSRKSILIRNNGADALRVGASGITASEGRQVLPGKELYIRGDKGAIYGISEGSTIDIRYLEVE